MPKAADFPEAVPVATSTCAPDHASSAVRTWWSHGRAIPLRW